MNNLIKQQIELVNLELVNQFLTTMTKTVQTALMVMVFCFAGQAHATTTDGNLDTTFGNNAQANGIPSAVELQSDGGFLIGGLFSLSANPPSGLPTTGLGRVDAMGDFDSNFINSGFSAVVAIGQQTDGRTLVTGGGGTFNGVAHSGIFRLNTDNTLDTEFLPTLTNGNGLNPVVRFLLQTINGVESIFIAGDFDTVEGQNRSNIARLNLDGTLDTSFNVNASVNGTVNQAILDSGGKILLGGTFTEVNGVSRVNVARLEADGTLDETFNPPSTSVVPTADNDNVTGPGVVRSIIVQPDNRILIAGEFNNVDADGFGTGADGVSTGAVLRLMPNGTRDSSFSAGLAPNSLQGVFDMVLQADARIVAGGDFTEIDFVPQTRAIVRLNSDGSIDPTFTADVGSGNGGNVLAIAEQPADQDLVIVGDFIGVGDSTGVTGTNGLARLFNGDAEVTAIRINGDPANNDQTLIEGNTFEFEVIRSGNLDQAVSVSFTTAGSGANGATADDFVGSVFPTGTVDFAAGVSSQTISIPVTDDANTENDESFTVTLSAPTNGAELTIQNTAQGTISDDDVPTEIPPSFRLTTSTLDLPEGDDGATSAEFQFTITRELNTNGVALIDYQVGVNTTLLGAPSADADDFGGAFPTNTITFNNGDVSATFTVTVIGDTTPEPSEFFTVTILNPRTSAGIPNGTTTTNSVASLIENDDTGVAFGASSVEQSQDEGNSFTFEVTREFGTDNDSTVAWAVTGVTADADDFGGTFPSGTLTFTGDSQSENIVIDTVVDDANVEGDETFTVTLSNPSNALINGADQATGTIVNNDGPATISFASDVEISQEEGDRDTTTFDFEVVRTGNPGIAASVLYTVSGVGSNATDDDDFVSVSARVEFAVGATTQTIQVSVVGDTRAEQDETFAVTLSDPSDDTELGAITQVQGVIEDDEPLCLPIEAANGSFSVVCM